MTTHSNIIAGKFHGQRSLVGYSRCDGRELDTTEQLSMHIPLLHKKEKHSVRVSVRK